MQAMLPQYQFECLLGRGGMGAVYKALQVSLDRLVAIKVLPGDLIDDADSQFADRFKNEARTMAKLNHPSIVNVYDFGETQSGLLFIVMEFIDGTDASKMIISQGRLPEDYALSITAHVCDALNYAHRNGVIHRDIKPANILINMQGEVKVADFGLAKQSDAGQSGLTKTNMAMGTPDFVAPEALIPGIPLDGRADLYAIGVMLYQMLTGEIPRGIWTLPGKKLGTDPRFDAIITKAMQTDRDHRYQSAADLRRDLDTILTLPRAALIAQQQAAAEAAARATQAQKQQTAATDGLTGSTGKKKSSLLGPMFGIAVSVILVAALYVFFTGDESEEPSQHVSTATDSPSTGDTAGAPKPISNTPTPSASPSVPAVADITPSPAPVMPAIPPADFRSGEVQTFGGHRYQLVEEKLRWDAAKAKAESMGGHLVTITSQEESEWLKHSLTTLKGTHSHVFLGGSRAVDDGRWTWVTEESFDQSLWLGTVPDTNDPYLAFDLDQARWDDVSDADTCAFLVEWDDDGTKPMPATPVASTTPEMPTAVPAATPPASVAPAATNTTNIAGPPKLQTKMLRDTADSLVVACSADGTRLIVAETLANGAIYLSKDSGATWTTASITGRWRAVASSADGTKLVVAKEAGSIYTSADAGATWVELTNGAGEWTSLACSADGTRIVALEHATSPGGRPIHISSDFGITWKKIDAGGDWWKCVASSDDGAKLVAVSNGYATGSYIFVSHDSGATWSKRLSDRARRWSSVASSADGSRLVAVDAGSGSGGQIYTSADSGETWTPREANRVWSAVTSSADGKILAAAAGCLIDAQFSGAHIDAIYISSDFGETWQPREMTRDWRSLASSADGALLIAASIAENRSGQVFTLDSRTAASKAGNDPRIAQLEKGFKGRLEIDADQPFRAALARLNQGYLTAGIPKARSAAQTKGSLLEVMMLDAEKSLIEKGGAVPNEDSEETPSSLKSLRTTYRGALAKITAERDAKAAPLFDIYLKAIDAYVAELTKAGKTDTAVRIQALRNEIAAQKPKTDATVAANTPSTPTAVASKTTPTPAPKPPLPSGGSSWRVAAEFLVKNGGSFVAIKKGAPPTTVAKEDEIPSGRFDIIELMIDRLDSVLPPPTDSDFAAFNGLRDLRRAYFRTSGPTDAAFVFLASNNELFSLSFEGTTALTDGLLSNIAPLKKLDYLAIQHAENFTGQGFDKISGAASITNLELLGCGITDEGMRAISNFKKLQTLRTTSPKITATGFASLANLKTLTSLTLSGTSFDDAGASAIAGIPNLITLDVQSTPLTDTGLTKLRSLKKLTSLILIGTAVTVEAAAEFQKVMPQCRVSR